MDLGFYKRPAFGLLQEGHTAHRSEDEANEMVGAALELYARTCAGELNSLDGPKVVAVGRYTELLAVPVVKGMKSEEERDLVDEAVGFCFEDFSTMCSHHFSKVKLHSRIFGRGI